jgi:hypothetical protein
MICNIIPPDMIMFQWPSSKKCYKNLFQKKKKKGNFPTIDNYIPSRNREHERL